MPRAAAQQRPVPLVALVVVWVGASIAAPPPLNSLTQQELVLSVIVNQMAILKGMNESFALSPAHDGDLKQLREELNTKMDAQNETLVRALNGVRSDVAEKIDRTKTEMRVLNETLLREVNDVNNDVEEMNERTKTEMRVLNETLLREVNDVNNDVEEMNERIDTKMSVLNERINNDINIKMNATNEGVNQGLRAMDERIHTRINSTMDAMNEVTEMKMSDMNERLVRALNDVNNAVEGMNDRLAKVTSQVTETNDNVEAMNESVERKLNHLNETLMNNTRSIMNQRQPLQSTTATPPTDHVIPASNYSLCYGHKVLYGRHGGFRVAAWNEDYAHYLDCSWEVTLPEGTRPVFNWLYFDIELSPLCMYDYVMVYDPEHPRFNKLCGDIPPDGDSLRIRNNKFKVVFKSDSSATGKGFFLEYRAVDSDRMSGGQGCVLCDMEEYW